VQKLLRLAEQVVFCFDGDAAGQKAAWRALENALPQLVDGKRIGFLFLPVEHDPDSYVREFGTEAFEALLDDSLPLSGYLLRELGSRVDLRTQEGRSNLLKSAQPLLTAISPNAPAMALLLRKEVAALAGVTQSELEALYAVKPIAPPTRAKAPPPRASRPAPSSLRMLLRCLLVRPELARRIPEDFAAEGNEAAAVVALADWLRGQEEEVSTALMIQHFQGSPHEPVFSAAEVDVLQWGEEFDIEAEVQGVLAKLREDERKRQWQEVNAKYEKVGLKGLDPQELARYRQLLQEHLAQKHTPKPDNL
jgi:DNA primase